MWRTLDQVSSWLVAVGGEFIMPRISFCSIKPPQGLSELVFFCRRGILLVKGDGSPLGEQVPWPKPIYSAAANTSSHPRLLFCHRTDKNNRPGDLRTVTVKAHPEAEVTKSREKRLGRVQAMPMASCDLKVFFCVCFSFILKQLLSGISSLQLREV